MQRSRTGRDPNSSVETASLEYKTAVVCSTCDERGRNVRCRIETVGYAMAQTLRRRGPDAHVARVGHAHPLNDISRRVSRHEAKIARRAGAVLQQALEASKKTLPHAEQQKPAAVYAAASVL